MNGRWVLAAAFALSVGVVACGGGGGGGNPNPPTPVPGTPTPVSSPTPTPTPTPSATSGAGNGALSGSCQPNFNGTIPAPGTGQYKFTGTLAQNTVYTYPVTTSPTTAPTQSPVSSSAQVTSIFGIGSATDPSGHGGLDLHVDEYDVYPLQTTTSGSDAWSSVSGSNQLLDATQMIAPDASSSPTSSTVQTFLTPPVIGSTSATFGQSNSNAGTLAQNLCYGLAYTRTIAAGGSYSESGTSQNGAGSASGTISIRENSDASGSITGPNPSGFAPKTFSAPSGTTITLTIQNGTTPAPTIPITLWFATPPVFYAENNSNTTSGVTEPGACPGGATEKIERVVTQLDTIMGYTETTTYDTYETASNGANCVVLSDTLKNYYDWSGDIYLGNRFATLGPGSPLSTTVTTEILGLASGQSGVVPFDTSRSRPISSAAIGAAASAHFDAILAATRARVLAHALRLRTTNLAGGI